MAIVKKKDCIYITPRDTFISNHINGTRVKFQPTLQDEWGRVYCERNERLIRMIRMASCTNALRLACAVWYWSNHINDTDPSYHTEAELRVPLEARLDWYLKRCSKHLFLWHSRHMDYLIDVDYAQLGLKDSPHMDFRGCKKLYTHEILAVYCSERMNKRFSPEEHDVNRVTLIEHMESILEEIGWNTVHPAPKKMPKSARSAMEYM